MTQPQLLTEDGSQLTTKFNLIKNMKNQKVLSLVVAILFLGIAIYVQIKSGLSEVVPVLMGLVSGVMIGYLLAKKD